MDKYKDAMLLSTVISSHFSELFKNLEFIRIRAQHDSNGELEFFRASCKKIDNFINSLNLPGANIKCKTKEIHLTPLVKSEKGNCELGDYFINVKRYGTNGIIDRRLVIYQFKYGNHSGKWTIDPVQLELLSRWPQFRFGKLGFDDKSYNLRPQTKDMGSYWFVPRNSRYYNQVCSAYDVAHVLTSKGGRNIITEDVCHYYPHISSIAILLQMMGRYGEPIENNTDIEDFLHALYRITGLEKDPPDEFSGFSQETENKSFWGTEISIKLSEKEGIFDNHIGNKKRFRVQK